MNNFDAYKAMAAKLDQHIQATTGPTFPPLAEANDETRDSHRNAPRLLIST